MQLPRFDVAAVARCLAQIADREGDFADAFFERREVVELADGEPAPEWRVRREEGFCLRLMRQRRSWLACRDHIAREPFAAALRQTARAVPQAPYPAPEFEPARERPFHAEEVQQFPSRLAREVRRHHVAFPLQLTVRRHLRLVRWMDTRLAPEAESERFYSLTAQTPWGAVGDLLEALTDQATMAAFASRLLARFHSRGASPPDPGPAVVILAPAAAATLVHEAVAHALETDTLALTGRPEAAIGLQLGPPQLSVLDDPGALPKGVRRRVDDEGMPVHRRWLLRRGKVAQPLADRAAAETSTALEAGCGRRASRGLVPVPRSTHLEILPGPDDPADLFREAEGGLYVEEVDRGRLDPATGTFQLVAPYGRRIRSGAPADWVGPFSLRAALSDLAERLEGVGSESVFAGAGWCAKGGHRLPVWATACALRLAGVGVSS
ncbi:MAG: metallopeptidase TldD-related protein [Thermoanaerobaculia bacterium]